MTWWYRITYFDPFRPVSCHFDTWYVVIMCRRMWKSNSATDGAPYLVKFAFDDQNMAELYRTERSWGIHASCTGKLSVLNDSPLPRVRTSLLASHYMAYAITSFALHGIAMTTILFRDIITWHDDIALLISTPFDLFHVISTHDMS